MLGSVVHASSANGTVDVLRDCEGFRVDTSGGRLGVVDRVRYDDEGAVESLLVVGGVLGTRRWVVPAADVAVVQPRRRRVGLVDGPSIRGV